LQERNRILGRGGEVSQQKERGPKGENLSEGRRIAGLGFS